MEYREAYEQALESFKEHFPEFDDATAEKVMNAFIEAKRREEG